MRRAKWTSRSSSRRLARARQETPRDQGQAAAEAPQTRPDAAAAQIRPLLTSYDQLRQVARSLEAMRVRTTLSQLCGAVPQLRLTEETVRRVRWRVREC